MKKVFVLIIMAMLFVGGCSTDEISTPEIIAAIATPEPTATPTEIPTSTNTPIPPTITPTLTPTSTSTSTPALGSDPAIPLELQNAWEMIIADCEIFDIRYVNSGDPDIFQEMRRYDQSLAKTVGYEIGSRWYVSEPDIDSDNSCHILVVPAEGDLVLFVYKNSNLEIKTLYVLGYPLP